MFNHTEILFTSLLNIFNRRMSVSARDWSSFGAFSRDFSAKQKNLICEEKGTLVMGYNTLELVLNQSKEIS